MSGPVLSYVCADRGIPVDGDKGASVHFREMGRALVRVGFDVHAAVRGRRGRTVSDVPFRVSTTEPDGGARSAAPTVVAELDELIRQESMLSALDAAPAPHLVYERYSLFGLAALRHARNHGVPYVLEVNAPLWEEAARFRSLQIVDVARSVARELLRGADLVLAVSPRLRQRLIDEGAPAERVRVFPNGVAPEFVQDNRVAQRPPAIAERPIVVFVGSLKPWHGIDLLLEALESGSLGEAALWVVGDGPLRDRVTAAATRNPERLVWEGAVPHARIASILRAADAAVAPYPADAPDYFCPLKVLEALCTGTPLLAASVPAVREILPSPVPVHWFEPDSSSDLGRALRGMLAMSPDRRFGFDPREHTWEARAREIRTWYECTRAEVVNP